MEENQKQLSESDLEIIRILRDEPRIAVAEIARKTGRSRIYISERINYFIENGLMQFSAVVKSSALGLNLAVFLEIEIEPGKVEEVATALSENREIMVVYQMTGHTTLHVHAYVEDTDALANFLKEKVYSIDGIRNVNSSILIKKFKYNLDLL